jgi:hypothetical protein
MNTKKIRKPKDQRSDVKNTNNREHALYKANQIKQKEEK